MDKPITYSTLALAVITTLSITVIGFIAFTWFYTDGVMTGSSKVWVLPEYKYLAEVAEFEVTAYDAYSAQSINIAKYRDGLTALNRPAVSGYTLAVDPRIIPFDSFVFIPGIGWRVAEDVGGAIKGYKIDVLMETKGKAIRFGRQKLHALWIPPKSIPIVVKKRIVRKQTKPKKKPAKTARKRMKK